MSSSAATVSSADITLTSVWKGDAANRIFYRQRIDPAGATGATTVVVSKQTYGALIDVYLKNTAGTTITATAAQILTALAASVPATALATAALYAGQTGTNTGAAYSGALLAPVPFTGGGEGTTTVTYDDLAAATGDGWVKQSGNGIDVMTHTRADGGEERQAAVSVTGAVAAVLAAGRTIDRQSRKGGIGGSLGA